VEADIENPKSELFSKRCFTMVVFPEPDGAEKIIALPPFGGVSVGKLAIKLLFGLIAL
jgi:hypothetical protein